MKIRFQADADLNQAIVTGILRREPIVDFQTANVRYDSGKTNWLYRIYPRIPL